MTAETIQQLKEDIAILQEKLQKLEEIEKQPRMNLQQEGEYAVVLYHDEVYYRLGNKTTFSWWRKEKNRDMARPWILIMIGDAETERLLEGLYYNHIQVKKEKEQRAKSPVEDGAFDDSLSEIKQRFLHQSKQLAACMEKQSQPLWRRIGGNTGPYDLGPAEIANILNLIADEVEHRGEIDHDRDPSETADWLKREAQKALLSIES